MGLDSFPKFVLVFEHVAPALEGLIFLYPTVASNIPVPFTLSGHPSISSSAYHGSCVIQAPLSHSAADLVRGIGNPHTRHQLIPQCSSTALGLPTHSSAESKRPAFSPGKNCRNCAPLCVHGPGNNNRNTQKCAQ